MRLAALGIGDGEQFFRQQFAEAAMDFADAVMGDGASVEVTVINPFLDGDVGLGFELEVPLAFILAVVVLQGAFDVDRVCVVPLDQVAVIAVHRAHEIGQRRGDAVRQASAESRRACRQVDGKVGEFAPLWRVLGDHEGFHHGDGLASVFGLCLVLVRYNVRSCVRFDVRKYLVSMCNYIICLPYYSSS